MKQYPATALGFCRRRTSVFLGRQRRGGDGKLQLPRLPSSPGVSTPTSPNCIPAPTGTSPTSRRSSARGRGRELRAEIALDVAAFRPTWLAGTNPAGPFRPGGALARHLFLPLMFRVIGHRILTVRTPVGREMRRSCSPTPRPRTRKARRPSRRPHPACQPKDVGHRRMPGWTGPDRHSPNLGSHDPILRVRRCNRPSVGRRHPVTPQCVRRG